MDSLKFPKPMKRHKDPKLLTRLRSQVRSCECGCGSNRALETHHIISRKMGGDDVEDNVLVLASYCHQAWHTWGGKEWFRRREARMADEAREKVRVALRLEEE